MNNSNHIHRFSFSAWAFSFLFSAFLLLVVLGVLAVNVQDLLSGNSKFSDYILIAFMAFLLIPCGLLILIHPFVTKIVVTGSGLEYHGLTYILSADWKDLVNIGYVKDTNAGKTLVVIPQGGKLQIRNWAKPFRAILVKKPQEVPILVSQFGTTNGHSFETDILVNVAHREEFVDVQDDL